MDAGFLFKVANGIAVVGWLMMVLAPRWQGTHWIVHRGLLPTALSGCYLILIVATWGSTDSNFFTLVGVSNLFKNEWILLLGWVHYLVFDMVIGSWALRDSWNRNISHMIMLPILLLIFMFGPVGYLLYQGLCLFKPTTTQPTTTT